MAKLGVGPLLECCEAMPRGAVALSLPSRYDCMDGLNAFLQGLVVDAGRHAGEAAVRSELRHIDPAAVTLRGMAAGDNDAATRTVVEHRVAAMFINVPVAWQAL